MSSKTTKKKRSKMHNISLTKKNKLSERNQQLVDQLRVDEGYIERFTRIFSKWRMITYFWIIFLPPYGLYRVWSKPSNFQKSEKYCWTLMLVVYMVYFVYNFAKAA